MAQRATEIEHRSGSTKASFGEGVPRLGSAATAASSCVIPLKLAPLLQPYKKHGRLSLRIERLPRLARLSAGRNNGDGTWSLSADEVEDLTCFLPDGKEDTYTLGIKVFKLDRGVANTLAVLDFLLATGSSEAPAQPEVPAPVVAPVTPVPSSDDQRLHRLEEELRQTKAAVADRDAALAARESELAKARREKPAETPPPKPAKSDTAEQELFALKLEAEVARARAQWSSELDQRLGALAAKAAADLEQQRKAYEAEQAARIALEAESRHGLSEAQQRWQQERDEALAKAEDSFKRELESRLATAASQWQQESAASLSAIRASHEAEQQRLQEEVAALKSSIAEREAAWAQGQLANEQARERWRRETEERLARAEQAWKTEEAVRLAASAAQWQEQSAKAWSEARTEIETASNQQHQADLTRLLDEVTSLKAAVAERDTALSQAKQVAEQARERWQRETREALTKSEQTWKGELAARIAAAEKEARKQSANALAEATSRYEAAEAALIQVRVRAKDETKVQQEVASLRAALANRESELVHARTGAPGGKIYSGPERRAADRRGGPRMMVNANAGEPSARPLIRDITAAVIVGASAIILFPMLEPYLPMSWRANIAAVFGSDSDTGHSAATLRAASPEKAVADAKPEPAANETTPPQEVLVALRDANVRSSPSSSAAIVYKLKRGREAVALDRDGDWVHIQISGEDGDTKPREGWVHQSLLDELDEEPKSARTGR